MYKSVHRPVMQRNQDLIEFVSFPTTTGGEIFLHDFSTILLGSNASEKCCLAVSFHCKKIKQDTSWSICAVTHPAILLNTRQEKKSMSEVPHSLYTSEGMPCGVKAEKT